MPQILYLGMKDALYRSRRMLLERAGYKLSKIQSPQDAIDKKSWRNSVLTIVGARVSAELREKLSRMILEDKGAVLDLAVAFRRRSSTGGSGVGPESFLEIVGQAVMAAHQHEEVQGDCVVWVDAERRYIHVTDGFLELVGFRRDEVIGSRIDDFAYPKTADIAAQFHRYLADGRQSGRFYLRHKSGRKVVVTFEAGVLTDGCMYSRLEPAPEE